MSKQRKSVGSLPRIRACAQTSGLLQNFKLQIIAINRLELLSVRFVRYPAKLSGYQTQVVQNAV